MNRRRSSPLRTVVFAPGNTAAALEETAASGADSMVVMLTANRRRGTGAPF